MVVPRAVRGVTDQRAFDLEPEDVDAVQRIIEEHDDFRAPRLNRRNVTDWRTWRDRWAREIRADVLAGCALQLDAADITKALTLKADPDDGSDALYPPPDALAIPRPTRWSRERDHSRGGGLRSDDEADAERTGNRRSARCGASERMLGKPGHPTSFPCMSRERLVPQAIRLELPMRHEIIGWHVRLSEKV